MVISISFGSGCIPPNGGRPLTGAFPQGIVIDMKAAIAVLAIILLMTVVFGGAATFFILMTLFAIGIGSMAVFN